MIKELEEVRKRTRRIHRLTQEYKAMQPSIRAVCLDGMPKGPGTDGLLEQLIDEKQEAQARIWAEVRELVLWQRAARMQLDRLEDRDIELRALCMHYYFGGHTARETCAAISREESTFYRWLRRLRAYDEADEAAENDSRMGDRWEPVTD